MLGNQITNGDSRKFYHLNQLINTGDIDNINISDRIRQAINKSYITCESEDNEYSIFTELEKRVKEIETNENKEYNRISKKIKNSLSLLQNENKQDQRDEFQLWNLDRDKLKFSQKLIDNTKAYKYNKISRHILKKKHIKLSALTKNNKKEKDRMDELVKDNHMKELYDPIKYSILKNLMDKE